MLHYPWPPALPAFGVDSELAVFLYQMNKRELYNQLRQDESAPNDYSRVPLVQRGQLRDRRIDDVSDSTLREYWDSYWAFTRYDRRTDRSVRLVCPTGRSDDRIV